MQRPKLFVCVKVRSGIRRYVDTSTHGISIDYVCACVCEGKEGEQRLIASAAIWTLFFPLHPAAASSARTVPGSPVRSFLFTSSLHHRITFFNSFFGCCCCCCYFLFPPPPLLLPPCSLSPPSIENIPVVHLSLPTHFSYCRLISYFSSVF